MAIRGHILPFYNKGVCQRPNVDDKIEIFLIFFKKTGQNVDSGLRMGISKTKKVGKNSDQGAFERLL